MSFDANSIKLIMDENKNYYGELDIVINITDTKKSIYNDHYILKSPYFNDSTNNNLLFIEQQRIALKNGKYELEVQVNDLHNRYNNELILKERVNIDFNNDSLSISDITFIEKFKKTEYINKITKNGIDMFPYVSTFFPPHQDTMFLYFEIYNSNSYFSNKKYLLNTYIETYENNLKLIDFNKSERMITKEIDTKLILFPIQTLNTGNYNIVTEIRDVNNELVIKRKRFFQRSNLQIDQKNSIITTDIRNTFVENITDIDSLQLFIEYLYPISTDIESVFAQNQKRYNNLLLMQKFFLDFWISRNLISPGQEWRRYYSVVKSINKEFKNGKLDGFKTDRGRVYLQYGAPNSRHKVDNSSANFPYEIWHYYKLNTQSDCKFVFVNQHLGIQDYKLIYSNVNGEISNQEWRDRLEQQSNPTFGDDFINNYINPR
jgi:GWxTD domain-containing protein